MDLVRQGLALVGSGRRPDRASKAGDNKAESRSSMTEGNNGRASSELPNIAAAKGGRPLNHPKQKEMRILVFMLLLCSNLQAQYYGSHIPVASKLILPPEEFGEGPYPLLVMLPFTSGDARYMFEAYAKAAGSEKSDSDQEKLASIIAALPAPGEQAQPFALMLPAGKGSRRDHSWRGFKACFERYESRLEKDIKRNLGRYPIDSQRIYLTGVSLGGDLSWAISQRQPQRYQGALVMGSRCSYPTTAETLALFKEKDYRFFMTMGMQEAPDRLNGMRYARRLLDSAGVDHIYKEMPELRHNKAELWLFLEGLRYLLAPKTTSQLVQKKQALPLDKIVGTWSNGEIEQSQFVAEEKSQISKGDELFVVQEETFLENQSLKIERLSEQSVRLKLPNLPAIDAYLAWGELEGEAAIELRVPEQRKGQYYYRGSNLGLEYEQAAGYIKLDGEFPHISFSVEQFVGRLAKGFERYSFFLLLE